MPAAMTIFAEMLVTSVWDTRRRDSEVSEAASHATPVFSAEYPSTCCMYSVPTKMKLKKLPPSSSPTTLAPPTACSRKIRSGTSGLDVRLDHEEGGDQRPCTGKQRDRAVDHPS